MARFKVEDREIVMDRAKFDVLTEPVITMSLKGNEREMIMVIAKFDF